MRSGRPRSRRRCSPQSSSSTPSGRQSATRSWVACDRSVAAGSDRANPRAPRERDPEIVASVAQLRLRRVEGDPYAQLHPVRPRFCEAHAAPRAQPRANPTRGRKPPPRCRPPPAPPDGLPHALPPPRRRSHTPPTRPWASPRMLRPQPGRSLNVTQQKRHRPRRQLRDRDPRPCSPERGLAHINDLPRSTMTRK